MRHPIAVAIVLVLLLPLQSMSAVLAPFFCGDAHPHEIAMVQHDHAGAHEQLAAHGHAPAGDSTHEAHGICHHVPAAAPSIDLIVLAPATLPVYSSSIPSLVSLFVPEQPRRPPRT